MLNSDHLVAIGLLVSRQGWAALCLGRTKCPIVFRAGLSSLSQKKRKRKKAAAVLRRRQEGLSLTARSATAHRLDGFTPTEGCGQLLRDSALRQARQVLVAYPTQRGGPAGRWTW